MGKVDLVSSRIRAQQLRNRPAVALLFLAISLGASRERHFMHDVMAPRSHNGTITDTELAAVSGFRRDRRLLVRSAARTRAAVGRSTC